jgi:uncharacterized protein YceK
MDIVNFKPLSLLSIIILLSACGTISTVPKSNSDVRSSLVKKDTKCSSVSRVYSGVAYDFCTLHSEPNRSLYFSEIMIYFYGVDMALSAVSDTLILPYTLVQQEQRGTIKINN